MAHETYSAVTVIALGPQWQPQIIVLLEKTVSIWTGEISCFDTIFYLCNAKTMGKIHFLLEVLSLPHTTELEDVCAHSCVGS